MRNDNEIIKYDLIKNKYSWLISKKQKAIISPDVDGILCGLFMSKYYDWDIVGFYDGKKLAIQKDLKPSECIFLDIEIYRKDIKSCGHHIILYHKDKKPKCFDEKISSCINPNIFRQYDAYKNFPQKYPLAMIHFLLCIISSIDLNTKIEISETSITSLLYADGVFKNLLNYPENCIDWLNYLNAKEKSSPIYSIYILFAKKRIANIIHDLEKIFLEFKKITGGRRGGDKINISDILNGSFADDSKRKIKELLSFLSNSTKWEYNPQKWILDNLKVLNFSKKINDKLNNKNFLKIIKQNPLSWAITATKQIEYILEKPDTIE